MNRVCALHCSVQSCQTTPIDDSVTEVVSHPVQHNGWWCIVSIVGSGLVKATAQKGLDKDGS